MKSTDNWRTPEWLCRLLPQVDLDPCSGPGSFVRAKRALSLENGDDGLASVWSVSDQTVFCNPPYSRGNIRLWVQKCVAHVEAHPLASVVLLVKLDPTTSWWRLAHKVPCRAYPFRKRIRFAGAKAGANFCSVLLVMTQDDKYELPSKLKRHLAGCLAPYPWTSDDVL